MRAPSGQVFPMLGKFIRIVEPEELVFLAIAHMDTEGYPGFEIENTVQFEDLGGQTKLTLKAVVLKAHSEDTGPIDGMEQGWSESLERLDSLVSSDHTARSND
jgi:uncharacterized protein YndB with AHSA1/START domain